MCTNPFTQFYNHEPVVVRCRRCWQCKQDRIDDWVGRNIAESKTAKAAHAVTLTYGRDKNHEVDHVAARVIMYSDFQKFMKQLRFDGYAARYFVAGEYGSIKGRAHFHALMYWKDRVPPGIVLRQRKLMFDWWPHGYAFWDGLSPKAVRYACKYLMQDDGDGTKQSEYHMSRMPPLGADYFRARAREMVRNRIAPQDAYYSFPEIRRGRRRKQVRFRMSRATLDLFVGEYMAAWAALWPRQHVPESELLDAYADRQVARWRDRNWTLEPRFIPGSWAERRAEELRRWAWLETLTPEEVAEQADRNWSKYSGKA